MRTYYDKEKSDGKMFYWIKFKTMLQAAQEYMKKSMLVPQNINKTKWIQKYKFF